MHAPFSLGAAELLVDAAHRHQPVPRRRRDARTRCASTPTPRCTRPRAPAAASHVYGDGTVDPFGPARAGRPPAARRSSAASSSSTTSRSCGSPTARVIGVESLVRWRDPSAPGLVPPGEFIPVAERTGVIEALGDWVLNEVCAPGSRVGRAGACTPNVGFNVSPRQLRRPDVARRFAEVVNAPRHRARPLRARDHRVGLVAGGLARCCRCSASCAPPASRWRSTTSAPATPRCGACASCRSRSSRSTARSWPASRTTRRRTAILLGDPARSPDAVRLRRGRRGRRGRPSTLELPRAPPAAGSLQGFLFSRPVPGRSSSSRAAARRRSRPSARR